MLIVAKIGRVTVEDCSLLLQMPNCLDILKGPQATRSYLTRGKAEPNGAAIGVQSYKTGSRLSVKKVRIRYFKIGTLKMNIFPSFPTVPNIFRDLFTEICRTASE